MSWVPSVQIAPSVLMPLLNFGVSQQHPLFLSLGGRGLDTAFDYGDKAQREVGASVASSGIPRSELFITTKIPCCPSAFVRDSKYSDHCHARRTPADTAADIAHDFQTLNLTYVDLMLVHWPCDSVADNVATWKVLEKLLFDGRARSIGVSNFNASILEALVASQEVRVPPAVNQVAFSIAGYGVSKASNPGDSPCAAHRGPTFPCLSHSDVIYRNQSWGRSDATLAKCRQLGVTPVAYSVSAIQNMLGSPRAPSLDWIPRLMLAASLSLRVTCLRSRSPRSLLAGGLSEGPHEFSPTRASKASRRR